MARTEPLRVLGFDPSLSNWGVAQGTWKAGDMLITGLTCYTITTEPIKTKQVRKSSLDLDRATLLTRNLFPLAQEADVIFVEMPIGSQSA